MYVFVKPAVQISLSHMQIRIQQRCLRPGRRFFSLVLGNHDQSKMKNYEESPLPLANLLVKCYNELSFDGKFYGKVGSFLWVLLNA